MVKNRISKILVQGGLSIIATYGLNMMVNSFFMGQHDVETELYRERGRLSSKDGKLDSAHIRHLQIDYHLK